VNQFEKNEQLVLSDNFSMIDSMSIAVLDACPVPCALNDEDLNITYLNKAFIDIVGYNLEDIPNLSAWWPKAYPDKAYRDWVSDGWKKRLSKAKESGENFEPMELSIHCKDGRVRTMLVNAASLTGKYDGTHLVILNDITDRKLSEVLSLRNAELFKNIFESFPTGVLLVDKSGLITQANNRLLEKFGYSFEELNGKPIEILVPIALRQHHKIDFVTYMNRPESRRMGVGRDLHGIRKNGSEFNVEIGLQPIETEQGLMILATVVDITERLKVQKELKLSEEWSRSLFENTNVCIASVDRQGNVDRFNKAFQELLGYDEETLRSKYFGEFTHPDDLSHEMEYFKEILENKRNHYRIEKRYIHRDGHIIWVDLSTSVIRDSGGNATRFVAVIHDITEQKELEFTRAELQSQVVQIQKLDSLGKMVGGIAHDFNNMLGSILGYAELLKLKRSDEVPMSERNQNYINQISMAGHRAKELISQMLIYSRPEESTSLNSSPGVLISPIFKEVMQLLRSMIASTIEINYIIHDDDLISRVMPVSLHQIILNLAINARDSIVEYGRMEFALERITASGFCASCHKMFNGDFASIKVSDTGCGISKEQLGKIFDPFYTTKEVGKGTGMGLSVVHGIVHGVNGHITVRSKEGNGSEFCILLPVEKSQIGMDEIIHKNEIDDTKLVGLSVLVVDDDPSIATMLSEFLNFNGMHAKVITNPTEALAEFKSSPYYFDMVILDVTMPKISGLDLAKSMLELRPGFPILMCTGFSERVKQDEIKKYGIEGFMRKPLELSKVLEWIKSVRYGQY